jgi:chemotaxis protein CheD
MKFRKESEVSTIYLKPGEVCFSKSPVKIITILGSCISIVMYSRSSRVGAICHAVMPSRGAADMTRQRIRDAFQYVDSSMEWMLSQFEGAGIKRDAIEVKMFGGSEIFFDDGKSGGIGVGKKNIEAAIRMIRHKNLKLRAWNIGGNKGRKLIFYTDTGEVLTKFVSKEINFAA